MYLITTSPIIRYALPLCRPHVAAEADKVGRLLFTKEVEEGRQRFPSSPFAAQDKGLQVIDIGQIHMALLPGDLIKAIWVISLRSLRAKPKATTLATAAAPVPQGHWNCRVTCGQGSDLAQVATAMASALVNSLFPAAHGMLSTLTELQCGHVTRQGV